MGPATYNDGRLDLSRSSFIVILNEREAIRWVLTHHQIAFTAAAARREARALKPGDELFLYITRGAWHNPTRHRGQIVGSATLTTNVSAFDRPLEIARHQFITYAGIRITHLTKLQHGLDLSETAHELEAIKQPKAWYMYLRRSLLSINEVDAATIARLMPRSTDEASSVLSSYFDTRPEIRTVSGVAQGPRPR